MRSISILLIKFPSSFYHRCSVKLYSTPLYFFPTVTKTGALSCCCLSYQFISLKSKIRRKPDDNMLNAVYSSWLLWSHKRHCLDLVSFAQIDFICPLFNYKNIDKFETFCILHKDCFTHFALHYYVHDPTFQYKIYHCFMYYNVTRFETDHM